MDIEYSDDTYITYTVTENIISKSLLLINNESLKQIIDYICGMDFGLAVGVMLNISNEIIRNSKVRQQYFDIFMGLKQNSDNQ